MRRLVKIIVFGIITLYLLVCYQVWNDKRAVNKYNKLIIKNTYLWYRPIALSKSLTDCSY